jgi:uroporphyrinogen-III synthase
MVRMLVTRPEPDASDTAARLRALGIEPVIEPLLRSEVLTTTLPDPSGFRALALTSGNALRALDARGELNRFLDLPVYAVGERTAQLARGFGFTRVDCADGNFADLAALIAGRFSPGPVFHPAGLNQAGDLAAALTPYGILAVTTPVYAMRTAEELPTSTTAALQSGAIAAALFYSPRTAKTFVEVGHRLGPEPRNRLGMLCLSEAVAAPLVAAHFVRVGLADHPSEEAMMALALSFARDQNPA